MTSPTPAKRLHEMNALEDMGQFPLVIYAGATGNVLATLTATWFLHHYPGDLRVLWRALEKLASTRVKVPPVELDGSRPKAMSGMKPRG